MWAWWSCSAAHNPKTIVAATNFVTIVGTLVVPSSRKRLLVLVFSQFRAGAAEINYESDSVFVRSQHVTEEFINLKGERLANVCLVAMACKMGSRVGEGLKNIFCF
ncbi:hypothetical protein Zmor_016138 [Zophobas morio]|uniref:Uncharacterized protein n=1 Tax=Zophobas morio TaxID=2755281 RepID=A0AA38MH85_9CUCU|nr:hypothetical protein Zmor_016138 [Zophobas morio]